MIDISSYTIRLTHLPDSVEGVTAESPDGHYNIYINDKLTAERRADVLRHELKHIENDDFHNNDSIRVIEARADR